MTTITAKRPNIDACPSASHVATDSKIPFLLPTTKSVVKVQTVCQRSVTLRQQENMCAVDVKEHICSGKDLRPDELRVICCGRECEDMDEVSSQCFALVKNTADRCVKVCIKFIGEMNKEMLELSVPLNMRISKLKEMLLKDKHTKWSVTGQRMIASSKVMKDYHILGDYLIHSTASKKGISPLCIHLSQTIDSKAEMEIFVTLANKQEIKFYFEFGIPLYYAKDILEKQFAIPKDVDYHLVTENGAPLADLNKCLLDYGILPTAGKKIRTRLVMASKKAALSPFPQGEMGKVMLCPIIVSPSGISIASEPVPLNSTHSLKEDGGSRTVSPVPSIASLKKKPDKKRKSNTCSMFGGMKKGFLSQSGKRKKH